MSRHRYPRSASIARQRARETEQLILSVLLLLLIVILWKTDCGQLSSLGQATSSSNGSPKRSTHSLSCCHRTAEPSVRAEIWS